MCVYVILLLCPPCVLVSLEWWGGGGKGRSYDARGRWLLRVVDFSQNLCGIACAVRAFYMFGVSSKMFACRW